MTTYRPKQEIRERFEVYDERFRQMLPEGVELGKRISRVPRGRKDRFTSRMATMSFGATSPTTAL